MGILSNLEEPFFLSLLHPFKSRVDLVHPDDFARYEEVARSKGFRHVASGPLVRSSYHAANFTPEADVLEAINEDLRKAGEL